MVETLDELDKHILGDLQEDARVPFRTIAEKQGVSIGTVHNRLKRLKKSGIVKGFAPILDDGLLGFRFKAITMLRVDGGHLEEVKLATLVLPGVVVSWQTSGSHDIMLVSQFRSMQELSQFSSSIARIPYAKAETNLVMGSLVDACIITKKGDA